MACDGDSDVFPVLDDRIVDDRLEHAAHGEGQRQVAGTGFGEQLLGTLRVVRVCVVEVLLIGLGIGTEDLRRLRAEALPADLHDRVRVDRDGERLAHADVGELRQESTVAVEEEESAPVDRERLGGVEAGRLRLQC